MASFLVISPNSVASGAHCVKVVKDVVIKNFTFAISSPDEFLVMIFSPNADSVSVVTVSSSSGPGRVELPSTLVEFLCQFFHKMCYKSSAVAEMGNRLAQNRNGPKIGGLCPLFEEGELGHHLEQCGLDRGSHPCQVTF